MNQNLSSEVHSPNILVSERRESTETKCTYIIGHEVCKVLFGETFSKEITEVTKNNEHEVADVGRDQNVVRGFLYLVFGDRFVGVVLRNAAITLISTVAEFRVNSAENLFRGRRGAWIRKARAVVIRLVKDGVL